MVKKAIDRSEGKAATEARPAAGHAGARHGQEGLLARHAATGAARSATCTTATPPTQSDATCRAPAEPPPAHRVAVGCRRACDDCAPTGSSPSWSPGTGASCWSSRWPRWRAQTHAARRGRGGRQRQPPTAPPSCWPREHAASTSSRLTANTGGAGGFAVGIERALTHEPDLVWLLDDDTVPTPDGRRASWSRAWYDVRRPGERPARARQPGGVDRRPRPPDEHPAAASPGACRGRASRPPRRWAASRSARRRSSRSCATPAVVRERGLPVADYFLWNDDFEYSTRLIRGRRRRSPARAAWWCTRPRRSARPTPTRGSGSSSRSATRSGCSPARAACSPAEKALYGGSTAAPLGAHVRALERPPHAGRAACGRGLRRRPDQPPAAQRRGARGGRLVAARASRRGPSARGQPFALLIARVRRRRPGLPARGVHLERARPDPAARTRWCWCRTARCPTSSAATIARPGREQPGAGRPRRAGRQRRPRARPRRAGWRPATHEIVARMDADDVSAARPVREAAAAGRGGRGHRRLGLLEFGAVARRRSSAAVRRRPTPTRSAA